MAITQEFGSKIPQSGGYRNFKLEMRIRLHCVFKLSLTMQQRNQETKCFLVVHMALQTSVLTGGFSVCPYNKEQAKKLFTDLHIVQAWQNNCFILPIERCGEHVSRVHCVSVSLLRKNCFVTNVCLNQAAFLFSVVVFQA